MKKAVVFGAEDLLEAIGGISQGKGFLGFGGGSQASAYFTSSADEFVLADLGIKPMKSLWIGGNALSVCRGHGVQAMSAGDNDAEVMTNSAK